MPMSKGFRSRKHIGDLANSTAVDKRRGAHEFYPGSCPLGGGSLHPASNLVYEHSCLQGAAEGGWVCVCCKLLCVLSRGYPLVALYMQPVRVYKSVSCLLLQVEVLGLAGFLYPSSGLLPWQEPGRQISRTHL
jgi:hypothetical protein